MPNPVSSSGPFSEYCLNFLGLSKRLGWGLGAVITLDYGGKEGWLFLHLKQIEIIFVITSIGFSSSPLTRFTKYLIKSGE